MVTLFLRFPGRRYHATPWGHHVNEGLVEWPPSPWRLLRAFLSVGYTALGWPGSVEQPLHSTPPQVARSLIEKLAASLPHYRLPAAAGAHSRHYMPLGALDKGREKTTLVLDTWAQVDDGGISITWGVDLSEDETALLASVAEHLGYLGRSESWVTARLAQADDIPTHGTECVPCGNNPPGGPGWEQVSLLAPLPPSEYGAWRDAAVTAALAPFPLPDRKAPRALLTQRENAQAPYPRDVITCMQVDVTWLREHGWSQPPGSHRVLYWRRADSLEAGAPRARMKRPAPASVEAMLLAMGTESGNDHGLPNVARTLPQAELLHRALVATAARHPGHSYVLSGRDESGAPGKGNHDHAHVLPLDLDGDGHLEHVLLWAPRGFDGSAQAAVRAVRRTFTRGGIGPLKLALVASGSLGDLRTVSGLHGDHLRRVLGSARGSTTWVSATPFVAPRHVKRNGKNSLAGQIADELAARGLPDLSDCRVLPLDEASGRYRLRHFVRRRRRGPSPPTDCGFCIELVLAAPAFGPIALGYGSHFGLGLFRSSTEG